MRSLIVVNCLLIIGFLAVIAGTVFMEWNGYNDNASHSIFLLHSINGLLLIMRAVLKG